MPLILGTNSIKDSAYNVANSLRFNDGSSDHLTKTPSSAGNRRTWTFSVWVKKCMPLTGGNQRLIACGSGTGGLFSSIEYDSSDRIRILEGTEGGSSSVTVRGAGFNRDPSAWQHVVVKYDSTQGTASDRIKIYLNGVEVTYDSTTYPSSNKDSEFNNTVVHTIGATSVGSSVGSFFDGYMAEVVLIDGQALDPTSFGEFDEDSPTIWKPKDVSGLTFGTNGFYLDFENSGSLGADVSGNGNNFTVNNLTSIDQTTDTCTNNFCTMNPLTSTQDFNLSEGNLKLGASADNEVINGTLAGTIDNTNSGYYFEYKVNASNLGNNGEGFRMGIVNVDDIMLSPFTSARVLNVTNPALVYQTATNGGASRTDTDIGSASNGDIVMVAWKNGKVWLGVNGTFVNSGNPSAGSGEQFSGLSGEFIPFVMCSLTNGVNGSQFNFGNPTFSISSGNADANGFGNFEYAPPTGFFALCTKNIAEIG